jgi:uncharacterized membrane protein (UPF0127 family)
MILASILSAAVATARPAPHVAIAVLPSGHEFTLEVAADPAARARGYMGREAVGPREGMLFLFDSDERHSFWMKDCKTALDIIWLDAALRVVWIAKRQPPCPPESDCPSIVPPSLARYVLEFAPGTAATESLSAGDSVIIISDPPLR